MGGVGAAVTNMIYQHIKSKKCVINSAKDFAEYANKIINGISCLYLAENKIMAEPQDIEMPPNIPGTLKVQKTLILQTFQRCFNVDFWLIRRRDLGQRQINVETTLCISTLEFTTSNNVESMLCISTLI